MAAQIIDGKAISERLREDMKAEVAAMSEKGMKPWNDSMERRWCDGTGEAPKAGMTGEAELAQ